VTTPVLSERSSFLKKGLFLGITPATLFLTLIIALAIALHLCNIESIGDANAYYTAAVQSMLKSWSNFFFIAAEPGGSVSVDKSPLGLWIEAAFAYFLGVNGLSVSLPNILAGIFSVPLLYALVKKYAGELAGLIAAFVMTVTPIFVATNRNNTMDGLLILFLLLAAWAFIKATNTGNLRWLLLGAFIAGLGFNTKMTQVLLPIPAFYALYFLGSKEDWIQKAKNLGIATILFILVSLSWTIVVDLTPPDQRPYIGSSGNNTVMGLVFGHNGISRLENEMTSPPPSGPQPDSDQRGKTQFSQETGDPSIFRFFIHPLSKQMSWLLPFALISIALILFANKFRLQIESDIHKALTLWGGWLLTCIVFFSMVSGIFHAYYAIMLAPPLGAMVGIGFSQLLNWSEEKKWGNVLFLTASAITLSFQAFMYYQYQENWSWMLIAGILLVAGIISTVSKRREAYFMVFASILIIPIYWTIMTVISDPNVNLPTAYVGSKDFRHRPAGNGFAPGVNEELLTYLEANTKDVEYLIAVPSAQFGASLVLATGRPVLFIGGFGGQDDVVTVDDLKAMVAKGELRYILNGDGRFNKPEITNWLNSSCAVMLDFSQINVDNLPAQPNGQAIGGNPSDQTVTLYMCKYSFAK
jgi:4-amino-4-deoxy-L-arabinose transferase-like glycosyltransferase